MVVQLGKPRKEEAIAIRQLSDMFSEEFIFTTSATVDRREIDSILICPRGIIVLEFKNYTGEVTPGIYGKWKTQGKGERKGQDVNPFEQASLAAKKLKSFFVERFESDWPLYIDSLVILVNDQAHLNCSELEADQAKHVCILSEAGKHIHEMLRKSDQISSSDCHEIVQCLQKPLKRARRLEGASKTYKATPVESEEHVSPSHSNSADMISDSLLKRTMREKFMKMVSRLEGEYEIGS